MSASTASLQRRTQAERSAETRARLLDATLACLIQKGYGRITTAEIEARAGVSRGARLHHFATKAILVAAAVERLYQAIALRYRDALAAVAPEAGRLRAGLQLLWEIYADPTHAAVLELYVVARTDPELRATLRELARRHQKDVLRRANAYFPELARPEAGGLFETIQAAFVGLAVQRMVYGERVRDEQVMDLIEHMVERSFGAPSPTREGSAGQAGEVDE